MKHYRILFLLIGLLPFVLLAQDKEAMLKEKELLQEKSALFDGISKFIVEDYSGVIDAKNQFEDSENQALRYFLNAHAAFKLNEFAKAKKSIDDCLDLMPNNETAIELAVQIAYASRNSDALQGYYEKLYALSPKDENLLVSLIEFYDGMGNFSKGERYTNELIELKGKAQEVEFYRARVLLSNNYVEEASNVLYKSLERGFFEPSFDLIYRIENLNNNNDKLNELKAIAPGSYVNSLNFVILNLPLLIDTEQYGVIIELFDTLSSSDIEYAQHLLDYPSLFLSQEAFDNSGLLDTYLNRLELVLGAEDTRLAICRGNLALNINNMNLAVEQYLVFAKKAPVELDRVIDLSGFLFTVSPESSLKFLLEFQDYFPDSPILFANMAKCYVAMDDAMNAKSYLKKAEMMFFDFRNPDYWEYLKIKILLNVKENDTESYSNLIIKNANWFSESGEYLMFNAFQLKALFPTADQALVTLQKTLKTIDNEKGKCFVNSLISILALELQNKDLAKEALALAAKSNADCATYVLAQAEYYRFIGDTSKALKFYKKAQEIDPNFAYISLIIEKLS